jgi:hypothetical protein
MNTQIKSLVQTSTTILFAFFLFLNFGQAQKTSIKFTPLQPIIGKMSVSVERPISHNKTLMIEYQQWFENRRQNQEVYPFPLMPVLIFSEGTQTRNEGFRLSALYRKYGKSNYKGGFIESGAYIGRHNIKQTEGTTIFGLLPNASNDEYAYLPLVRQEKTWVTGLRLGGGFHKAYKSGFSLEFSGGLNFNLVNSKNFRPSASMGYVMPYSRFALGWTF